MKKIIAFLCTILLVSCTNNTTEPNKKELHKLIDQWHMAAAEANFDKYFEFIATDGIFIGTDITERWAKEEFSNFSKPYFDKGKAWSFVAKERNLRIDKNNKLVWFDEVLDTWMGDCRSTGVLELIGHEWKLQHYQLSMTVDNDLVADFLKLRAEKHEAQN